MVEKIEEWEYRVETVGSFWKGVEDEILQDMLNAMGEEGWEVIAFRTIENTNKATLIAKRPLTHAAKRWRSMP